MNVGMAPISHMSQVMVSISQDTVRMMIRCLISIPKSWQLKMQKPIYWKAAQYLA